MANVRVHVKAARNLKAFLGGPFEINDPYVKVRLSLFIERVCARVSECL